MGEVRYTIRDGALGRVLVAATARGLCAVLPADDDDALLHELARRFPDATLRGDDPAVEPIATRVLAAIDGHAEAFDGPLDLRGTPFQQSVWQELRRIPRGATASYTDIATRVGRPRSVRAVAQACGANPIAVIVPCHRVVARSGALTGYRWGLQRKRVLLEHEAALAPH